jgi:hypothetical protein
MRIITTSIDSGIEKSPRRVGNFHEKRKKNNKTVKIEIPATDSHSTNDKIK